MTRQLPPPGGDFAARMSALRAKTGLTDERRLEMVCARSAESFRVICTREDSAQRYRISRYERHQAAAPPSGIDMQAKVAAALTAKPPPRKSFDAREFDLSGLRCECCGDTRGLVICGECGENVCYGRSPPHRDGVKLFVCQERCGAQFTTAPAGTISGAEAARPAAIGRSSHKALSAPARRLPPPGPKLLK